MYTRRRRRRKNRKGGTRKLDEALQDAIERDYGTLSNQQLADVHGVSTSTVKRIAKKRRLTRKGKKRPKSGFFGVVSHRDAWVAQTKEDGKYRYLGRFTTPEAAAVAYDDAVRSSHGQRSRLNFPSIEEGLEAKANAEEAWILTHPNEKQRSDDEILCSAPGCRWRGARKHIAQHWNKKHQDIRAVSGHRIPDGKVCGPAPSVTKWCTLQRRSVRACEFDFEQERNQLFVTPAQRMVDELGTPHRPSRSASDPDVTGDETNTAEDNDLMAFLEEGDSPAHAISPCLLT